MKKIFLTSLIIALLILLISITLLWSRPSQTIKVNTIKKIEVEPLFLAGYSKKDIAIIKKILSDHEIEQLINLPYDANLIKYLNNPLFCFNKLSRYQAYAKNHTDNIVLMVNMNRDLAFYQEIKEIKQPQLIDVLVNKYYRLPEQYTPTLANINQLYTDQTIKIASVAINDFEQMMAAAKQAGMKIKVSSAYRPKNIQTALYNGYVKYYGVERADIGSARPRHSEHETGLAIDLKKQGETYSTFGENIEYQWILNNSYQYGFIIRYPEDKINITGYKFEPWHIRYVGKDIAKIIWQEKISLEEYHAKYKELEC